MVDFDEVVIYAIQRLSGKNDFTRRHVRSAEESRLVKRDSVISCYRVNNIVCYNRVGYLIRDESITDRVNADHERFTSANADLTALTDDRNVIVENNMLGIQSNVFTIAGGDIAVGNA